MKNRSFTLIEIIVVLVIIGILSTLGVTQYRSSVERALEGEAVINLNLIAAAERIVRMEGAGAAFVPCSCFCAGTAAGCCDEAVVGCNSALRLRLSTQDWIYSVTSLTGANFTAVATRAESGCTYALTDTDADGKPNPNANCRYVP
jgi:prepilin-type N-terminal cleavage/methylation domain-containing protein